MKKAIILSIIGLIIVVGVLAGIKALQIRAMMAQGAKFVMIDLFPGCSSVLNCWVRRFWLRLDYPS